MQTKAKQDEKAQHTGICGHLESSVTAMYIREILKSFSDHTRQIIHQRRCLTRIATSKQVKVIQDVVQ